MIKLLQFSRAKLFFTIVLYTSVTVPQDVKALNRHHIITSSKLGLHL
jgi:hypothetical protein